MVFNVFGTVFILFWLFFLTAVVLRMWVHYNRLAKHGGGKGLLQVLEGLLKKQQLFERSLGEVNSKFIDLLAVEKLHIQRIGIVRFNPFSDTGGNQSFVLALLDGEKNGIVLTSLYTRGSGRWYIKQIHSGEGVGLSLSREEAAAIASATQVGKMQVES